MPRPAPAAKRTVAARLPAVLALQLKRGFWSPGGHYCKVSGPVAFPLRLSLPPGLLPLLGHDGGGPGGSRSGTAAAAEATAASEAGAGAAPAPAYELRAVVVHHGHLAGRGHYTVFRRLDGGCGCGGCGGCGGASNGGGAAAFVRVSDDTVAPATAAEALAAEATLLLYERCGGGGPQAAL